MNQAFEMERIDNIRGLGGDERLRTASKEWIRDVSRHKYSYNFNWLGRPIIQFPQDIIAMQEIIWGVKPELIIETGIAHGGSTIFYASMLELIGNNGRVIGIDIEIREHNRRAIEAHPMYRRIELIEGDSTAPAIINEVNKRAAGRSPILVALDSNHTHSHVLKELEAYSPMVTKGSYLVVFDTVIENMPQGYYSDRPWDVGNNPKTALRQFLSKNKRFSSDKTFDDKLLISVAPEGYLKCISD